MNKNRFDLRALVSLTCTVGGEEKQGGLFTSVLAAIKRPLKMTR